VCEHSKNVILAPLRLCPEPRGSDSKIFFFIFFSGSGPWLPQIFRSKSCKKFWGKIPPRGSKGVRPPNFWKSGFIPPYGNVPANFHPISLKLWRAKIKKNVILAPVRLRPEPRGVRGPKFFWLIFPGSGAWLPHIFKSISRKKNLGKISPSGVRPPKFLEKWMYPPYSNVPANFHPDISKTVACRPWRN